MTPLMWAARRHRPEAVEWLLARGADLHLRTPGRGTALVATADSRGGSDMLQLLLARGADPDARDASGFTALMYAVQNKDLASAATLIRAGAAVNARDHVGQTALFIAEGDEPMNELLLAAGAR